MIPEEKAKLLVKTYYSEISGIPIGKITQINIGDSYYKTAVKCALISVNELLYTLNETSEEDNSTSAYHTSVFYNEVKTELKKLL